MNVIKGQVYKRKDTYEDIDIYVGVRSVENNKVHFSELEVSKLLDLVVVWEIDSFLRIYQNQENMYLHSIYED